MCLRSKHTDILWSWGFWCAYKIMNLARREPMGKKPKDEHMKLWECIRSWTSSVCLNKIVNYLKVNRKKVPVKIYTENIHASIKMIYIYTNQYSVNMRMKGSDVNWNMLLSHFYYSLWENCRYAPNHKIYEGYVIDNRQSELSKRHNRF